VAEVERQRGEEKQGTGLT